PPKDVQVVSPAPSLPQKILPAGDPYPAALGNSCQAVARRLRLPDWHVAYQSAGATADPWLGPAAADVITDLARAGSDGVLLVPIGFVCDHVEILYDIDIEYQALAQRVGRQLERT